ncbi:MAG: matrixin family metalloprotease [Myxococcales bacterium]
MKTLHALPFAVLAVFTALSESKSLAFTAFSNCNGVVSWNHLASIERDTCSLPNGSNGATALSSLWSNWQNDTTSNLGSIIATNFGCSLTYGDGRNEIMLVSQATLGSGVNALTTSQVSTCFFSHGTFNESDIISSVDLSYSPQDESFWNWSNAASGAVVVAHEVGHFLGLGHSEVFDIMRANTPYPLTGGNMAQPFADEANGARWLYPGGASKANAFASAQMLSGGAVVATNMATTLSVCRGQAISVTVTVVNPGTVTFGSVGFRVAVTQTPNTGGTNMFVGTATTNPGSFFTQTLNLTVPNVANGFYWVIWQNDTGNAVSETIETDNAVHSAMTLSINC